TAAAAATRTRHEKAASRAFAASISRLSRPKPRDPASPTPSSSARTCRPPTAARRTDTRFSAIGQSPCFRRTGVLRFRHRVHEGMTMAETATLSSKFPISIPKAIRAAQHWEAGLTFAFIPKGTGVLLVPVPKREALKGLARGASATDYRDRSDRV